MVGRFLPNPFAPHQRIYRMRWSTDSEGASNDALIESLAEDAHFTVLRVCILYMAVALLLLLPVGLLSRLGFVYVIAALALFYASLATTLVYIYWRRDRFGIGKSQFASLALQCIVCPPFALNIVRKLCAATNAAGDLVATAAKLLQPHQIEVVKAQCRVRLDEQIDLEPEGTKRSLAMSDVRQRLAPQEDLEP